MTKTFTKNDLVRFLFDEMNEDERFEMKEALSSDIHLRTSLEEMKEASALVESFSIKAPDAVVSRILYASRNLQSA